LEMKHASGVIWAQNIFHLWYQDQRILLCSGIGKDSNVHQRVRQLL